MSINLTEGGNVTPLSKKSAEKARQYWWSAFYVAGARQAFYGQGTVYPFKAPLKPRKVELCLTKDNRQYCKI